MGLGDPRERTTMRILRDFVIGCVVGYAVFRPQPTITDQVCMAIVLDIIVVGILAIYDIYKKKE